MSMSIYLSIFLLERQPRSLTEIYVYTHASMHPCIHASMHPYIHPSFHLYKALSLSLYIYIYIYGEERSGGSVQEEGTGASAQAPQGDTLSAFDVLYTLTRWTGDVIYIYSLVCNRSIISTQDLPYCTCVYTIVCCAGR
jgi:hypothetical protein